MRIRLGIGSMGLSLAAAALAVGCGGGRDAVEQQLSELRAELVRVRAESAVLAERVGSLERSRGAAPGAARPPEAGARAASPSPDDEPDRPDLEVVRLTPEGGDEAAPPVLRSTAGGVVLDDRPGASPEGPPPSTPSRRKR
ncbi:hypothetical protein WMF31_34545 [Sorangium sp. So ce1036]|uniref:hypothetical protein n=1 Tax=Sorangium sp. So ce1036 TaxID=3133328 RepID=UPI003F117011